MIRYVDSVEGLRPEQLEGFFVGWPNPPASATHLELLRASFKAWLAIDDQTDAVVGFVTAVSDGILAAYIPLIEVLPAYQRRGIGKTLMRRMLADLQGLYMVDVQCDPDVRPFYESVGMEAATGMRLRNYENQSGKAQP